VVLKPLRERRLSTLRVSEWIVLGYFAYVAAAAVVVPVEAARRRRTGLLIIGIVATLFARSRLSASGSIIRDWLPIGDIILAYWLPAAIARPPNEVWEQRFLALDRRWLRLDVMQYSERLPGVIGAFLELSYLFCYPMIPAGLAALSFAGFRGDVDRFWTSVLLSVLPCYGLVVWVPLRPPRMLEGAVTTPSRSVIRGLNLQILSHASIQLNTFPSAHVAGSIATMLAVASRLPLTGAALGVVAAGITIGSVLRRYHYAVDALAGVALGVSGFVVSRYVRFMN